MNDNFEYKNLMIFDMDHTILNDNTDSVILDLFSNTDKKSEVFSYLKEVHKVSPHYVYMQEVYKEMKKIGVKIEDIKTCIEKIELNEGFKEIFEYINLNKDTIDCILVSSSNTIYVDWIFNKFDLFKIFNDNIHTLPANVNDDVLIKIDKYHENEHQCEICEKSFCKTIALENFLGNMLEKNVKYNKKVYMGDGSNDFCPGSFLDKNDILFPRIDFPLYKKVNNPNFKDCIKCSIVSWKSGFDILNELKTYF